MTATKQHEQVQDYYGKTLQHSDDLQTDACCTTEDMPDYLKKALGKIHAEVLTRYYGCGLILPECLDGLTVLDLGCGAGRDVYVLSQLVGEQGKVIGVDMTEEQLAVAREHEDYHRKEFGYAKSNVEFLHGYIEKLDELELADKSIDLIVSNCVLNLSPDKAAILSSVKRLLKPGGEMYFSDVYADRRLSTEIQNDPVLVGECLGGALYWNDFINLAKSEGFTDPRLVKDRPLLIENPELAKRLGSAQFYSATYRLLNIDSLEPDCEDYGQAVIYRGTISKQEQHFLLDAHHLIETGKVFPVCGNTWHMLKDTRFAEHFEFIGNFKQHYGLFEGCGKTIPFETTQNINTGNNSDDNSCC